MEETYGSLAFVTKLSKLWFYFEEQVKTDAGTEMLVLR